MQETLNATNSTNKNDLFLTTTVKTLQSEKIQVVFSAITQIRRFVNISM